jgi:hypothetical protein
MLWMTGIMNCKKTSHMRKACLANLLVLTLCTSSSEIYAASSDHGDASHSERLNFWRWLFLDAVQQTLEVSNELQCLALNIYFEARSESIEGQHAVGHVVMNRVAHQGFPNSICAVVKQGGEENLNRCQFSWWCDGRPDKPVNQRAWLISLTLAFDIYFGNATDPTHGALWYHADYVSPKWSKALTMVTKIGQHLFYMSRKHPAYAINLNNLDPML